MKRLVALGRPLSRAALLLSLPIAPLAVVRAQERPRPALLVFFTVDQFSPIYFERFRSQFTGGLAKLLDGGAVFTDAHQDHAITETAPGHASTMSGRFPRSTGITRNLLGVGDDGSPLIGAPDPGASPFRFRGTTVTDWLISTDPKTRALSVSMKDRAAILPIGRSKQDVYWFSVNGTFTTSVWYRDTLPTWVQSFNARKIPASMAGKTWDLLLDPKRYAERDSVPIESNGRDFMFPHRMPTDTVRANSAFRLFPFMDQATLDFALAGVNALNLGRGPTTDVLAISLSSTDVIGHIYGPDSREQHDQIVRLDRAIGAFLDSLFKLRDSTKIILAMTADHGIVSAPELIGDRFSPHPVRVEIGPALQATQAKATAAGGTADGVDFESGALFIPPSKIGHLTVDQVIDDFRQAALKIPGVSRIDKFTDLAARDPRKDPIARRWTHMFPADEVPAAVVTLTPGSIYDYGLTATHGSPYDYDTNVPLIFYGGPFRKGTHKEFCRTVDIAPTLARALQVTPTEPLDGHVLSDAFEGPPKP